MSFQCTVVTPDAQVLSDSVSQVILPAHDGEIGILTDRAPLLCKIGVGQLRVDLDKGGTRLFFVEGGVAQMKDNKLTILTTTCTPAEELDAESARAELAEAQARRVTDAKTAEDRNAALQRGRVKQQMASRR